MQFRITAPIGLSVALGGIPRVPLMSLSVRDSVGVSTKRRPFSPQHTTQGRACIERTARTPAPISLLGRLTPVQGIPCYLAKLARQGSEIDTRPRGLQNHLPCKGSRFATPFRGYPLFGDPRHLPPTHALRLSSQYALKRTERPSGAMLLRMR